VIVGRDISERRRLEAQLLHAQKMESVGQLAGGVAHDFNNLLTAISGYADLARATLQPVDAAQGDLEEIQKAVQRASGLTRQLLAFARKQVIAPRILNLNDLIIDVGKLLRRLIGEDIHLVTHTALNLGAVTADPHQIEQLLVNLAVNARDAMPDGGALTIETANTTLNALDVSAQVGMVAGPYVQLVVSDTGVGMDAEVKQHLFEPFFTTKGVGKGTGLGLATCYGIVRQHGGHIAITSEAGRGASVRIVLPRVDDLPAERAATDTAIAQPVAQGAETILLVEDEATLRTLAARVLRACGYIVLETIDGVDALQTAQAYAAPIDLLLTDVVMPHMGGPALVAQLAVARPSLKVLFISGYTDNMFVDRGQLDPGINLLQKPFTSAALARKVREILDA
jgi:nitrogen-specific signal transduction histidine kinase